MTRTRAGATLDLEKLARWHADPNRLVADGIALPDLVSAAEEVQRWEEWYPFWERLGEDYADRAERTLAGGSHVLAGDLYWRACMAFHYAQFFWFQDPPRREAGQRRKAELYRLAAPLMLPPADPFTVDVNGVEVRAFVRLPLGSEGASAPVVLLLGGLESTKEESYLFENECLRRGVGTCVFDGPGQGETYFQAKLRHDFERFTSAVLDALLTRPEVNPSRVGVLGRSLGGNYAVRSAAMDQRLVACAAWGALADMSFWASMGRAAQVGFAYVAGYGPDQLDDAGRYLQSALDLQPVLSQVRCPVYIQHGELDDLIPVSQVDVLRDGLVNAAEVVVDIVEDGNHCAHNRYQLARPRVADWIIDKLGGTA